MLLISAPPGPSLPLVLLLVRLLHASPGHSDRHVRQAEIINMHEDGRPIPYAHASTFAASSAATKSSAAGATTSARPSIGSGSSARTIDSANGDDGDSSSNDVMTKSSSPSSDGVGQSAGEDDDLVDDQAGGGMGQEGLGSEVTLCRVPTIACLGSACGQAGSNISVLWEGFGCVRYPVWFSRGFEFT